MSDKDPKTAKEVITRGDINRTLDKAGKEKTETDVKHARDLNKKLDKK